MVTPASNQIQYHQIIKQIYHTNITIYIFNHSVHCVIIIIIGRHQSCLALSLIVSHQTNGPLQVDFPEIYYSLGGCSIKVITPFEIGEEGCHIYLEILHRYAGFEKIYPRVISRN